MIQEPLPSWRDADSPAGWRVRQALNDGLYRADIGFEPRPEGLPFRTIAAVYLVGMVCGFVFGAAAALLLR